MKLVCHFVRATAVFFTTFVFLSFFAKAESRSQKLRLELDSLKAEVAAAEQAVVSAEKALNEATKKEGDLQMKVGEMKGLYDEAKSELASVEESMSKYSSELTVHADEKATLVKKAETAELEAKKLSVAISRIQKEKANAERFVANMLKKHAWIDSEKSAFGVEGGDYDFEATSPSTMSKLLQNLKHEQGSLVRRT